MSTSSIQLSRPNALEWPSILSHKIYTTNQKVIISSVLHTYPESNHFSWLIVLDYHIHMLPGPMLHYFPCDCSSPPTVFLFTHAYFLQYWQKILQPYFDCLSRAHFHNSLLILASFAIRTVKEFPTSLSPGSFLLSNSLYNLSLSSSIFNIGSKKKLTCISKALFGNLA